MKIRGVERSVAGGEFFFCKGIAYKPLQNNLRLPTSASEIIRRHDLKARIFARQMNPKKNKEKKDRKRKKK